MTKGIPLARDARLSRATIEAKRVMLYTKSWDRTHYHLQQWLRVTFALSRGTVSDYIQVIQARLLADSETRPFFAKLVQGAPPVEFVKASEL